MPAPWLAMCLLVFGSTATHSENELRPVKFRTQTMGTWGSLTLVTSDSASVAELAYRALLRFHHVDSLMSNWTASSEVARINREASARAIVIDREVARVLLTAQQVGRESNGAFDITVEPLVRLWGFIGGPPRVPSESEIAEALTHVGRDKVVFDAYAGTVRFDEAGVAIDLGGIAKGYAADTAADVLRRAHATNALLDLSGNMVAMGNAAGHAGWTVGIRDPSDDLPFLARLQLYNEAVATSGDYEQFVDVDGTRYGHILDPRTGWSATGLVSVTVVTEEAMVADAWATALFVLGSEAARTLAAARDDLAVVLVEAPADSASTVWVEQQLRPRFELEETLEETYTVRYF